MEHITSPADVFVVFIAFAVLAACGIVVGTPLAFYRSAVRVHRSSWEIARPTLLMSGVYRGMVVSIPARVRLPRTVIAGSVASFYMALPALAALPFVVMGLCGDLETRSAGPAVVLGVPGIVIAIASVSIGRRLLRRARLSPAAVVIAIAELVFAFTASATVLFVSMFPNGDAWDSLAWDRGGALVAVYAGAAAIHACVLLAAAAIHERVTLETACT